MKDTSGSVLIKSVLMLTAVLHVAFSQFPFTLSELDNGQSTDKGNNNYFNYDFNDTINVLDDFYGRKSNISFFRKLRLFGPQLWSNHTKENPLGFIVVAPSIIQPSSIYSAVVSVSSFEESPRLQRLIDNEAKSSGIHFRLSLFKDGADIQGSNVRIFPGSSDVLKIKVPVRLPRGEYKIRIEGDVGDAKGGSLFASETQISFSEKFLSILIQANRHVYNGEQTVYFRAISLRRDLTPYDDPVDVYILDPRGIIMRRWPSVPSYQGVIDLQYSLPPFTALGHWTIRVVAASQIQEKKFLVERYFPPQFEVYVSVDPFILSTEETLTASVAGFYGTEKTVRGNATVSLYATRFGTQDIERVKPSEQQFTLLDMQYIYLTQEEELQWPMRVIYESLGASVENVIGIRIEAEITEYFLGETVFGYAESRIIKEKVKLRFLETAPKIFKPGLPFSTVLAVGYKDLAKIPREILENSTIRVTPRVFLNNGQVELDPIELQPNYIKNLMRENEIYSEEEYFDKFGWRDTKQFVLDSFLRKRRENTYVDEGVVEINFMVPKRAVRILLRAEYFDETGSAAVAELTANSAFTTSNRFISVSLRTGDPVAVGNFVVLLFSSTFKIDSFHYVVMAKGLIISHGTERLKNSWSTPHSFTTVVSAEMVPGFHVVVYAALKQGEVISDSVFVPVDNFQRNKISMNVNGAKDRSKDSVEIQCFGDAAAYFGISAQRSSRHVMQGGNELTQAYVFQTLHSLEPWNRTLHKLVWRDRSGEKSDVIRYFSSMSYALDTYRNFQQSSLVLFTDGFISTAPQLELDCPEEQCLTGGCYLRRQSCDGRLDCADATDELFCDYQNDDDIVSFRVNRISRFGDFYDVDNEWEWEHVWIAHGGDQAVTLQTPETTDTWYFTAFSVSKKNGFSLLETPIEYGTDRPFMMVVDYASQVRRGEQVGIIAMLYNKTPIEILVLITVADSEDYVFVHTGKHGQMEFVEGYPRFSTGEHQQLLWMPPESEREIRIAVKPVIDQGSIEVTITATTQIRTDIETCEIEILPEGGGVGKHTSLLLDMRNRAVVLKYMNIFVEEVPWVPYEIKRKYVYGSPSAHVTISGDVIGPLVNNLPCTMSNLLGKDGKGTADRLFELSANVWTLHYLRLTNQLTSQISQPVFVHMNKLYAWIMKRFSLAGYFKMWNVSQPSVWLSSWALQIFQQALFQDWENDFFIEKKVFTKVVSWLLEYQNLDGSFSETEWYDKYPLNKKMGYMKNMGGSGWNVSLTAHLLITLHSVAPILDGHIKVKCLNAKQEAMRFLERNLPYIYNPYQVAITTYALTMADSTEKEPAFGKLHNSRIEMGEFVYFSPDIVVTNEVTYENNRPFLEAKNNEFWDSVAVEATSYALLVYLIRGGITPIPDRMVSWLNTMRLVDGAFISSVDSAVAFQALTEYANRERIRDITDMSIKIQLSSSGEDAEPFEFSPDRASSTEEIEIEKVWGHVNIEGRGAGQAVVQLDITYGVDWEEFKDTPPVDAFELTIREFFGDRRNKSDLIIESCFRWILSEESEFSGGAVLEVETPSGYGLLQSDAVKLVASGIHPNLKDVWSVMGLTSWFFERIPAHWTCFNHTLRRWYPVANLTRHRQATLYEAYAPERFVNTLFNDTSLMLLDICQVCGSYQCPYCPFYNSATKLNFPFLYCLIITISMLQISVNAGLFDFTTRSY